MLNEIKNYPKIRFKGFEEPWKQYKYGELGEDLAGGNLSYDSLSEDGKYKCILYGDLYTLYDTTIDNIQRKTNLKGNTVYKNDILFPQSTTVDAYSLISPACLNEETAETSGCFVIRPKKDINGNFVAYYTKGNNKQRQKLAKNAQGLTIVHLYYNSIKDETLFVPKYEEQSRIGTFFSRLDSLIDLSDKRINSLKSIKSSLLAKLFCNGSNLKPTIRFKGFEDAWEEKRLGELGKTFTGLSGKTAEDFGHGKAKFLPYLNIFTNPIADVNFLESIEIDNSQNQIQKGDIFFTVSSETPEEVGMSSVWLGNIRNVYLNSFCFGFRPSADLDPYYMGFLLRSDAFRKPVTILAQGISRFNISKNKVMDIKIPLPVKQEQQKIGKFFEKLDELIALESKKSEKLRNIKSSLLNSMFC